MSEVEKYNQGFDDGYNVSKHDLKDKIKTLEAELSDDHQRGPTVRKMLENAEAKIKTLEARIKELEGERKWLLSEIRDDANEDLAHIVSRMNEELKEAE